MHVLGKKLAWKEIRMRRLPVTFFALTFALPCAAAGSFQHVEGHQIDFLVDGKALLRYMYAKGPARNNLDF